MQIDRAKIMPVLLPEHPAAQQTGLPATAQK